ncbi:MAG: sulfite oxidase, partial [Haloferacaceae archaeon]
MTAAAWRARVTVPDVLVSLCAGAAGVAGSYAVAGATPGFVAAPVAAFLSRTMPGAVVTAVITVLGSLGQVLNLGTAVALTAVGFGAVVHAASVAADRTAWPALVAPVLGGVGVGVAALALTGSIPPATGAGVAAGVVAGAPRVAPALGTDEGASTATADAGRRRVLAALVGLGGAGAVGAVAGNRAGTGTEATPVTGEAADLLAEAREKSLGVAGMDPLVSEDFYEVDVNSVNPKVAVADWSLSVTGAVGTELELDYGDVTGRESREVFESLRCVGEPLNGHKMDNALWTVVDV